MPHRDDPSWDSAYESDVHRWWHLSRPSPELLAAVADGWISSGARLLDLGCGLGSELARLAEEGDFSRTVGVDRSMSALSTMKAQHRPVHAICADVTMLPFVDHSFDIAIDRGCFHYLSHAGRRQYGCEAARVLCPGGRLLLRACVTSGGVRNDIDEAGIEAALVGWRLVSVEQVELPSDTRTMAALVVRPNGSTG